MKIVWLGLAAVLTFMVVSTIARRRRRAKLLASIRADWGKWRERDRDMAAISGYHRAIVTEGLSPGSIDDRTWVDLNMDDVFTFLDRTESVIGQQGLYRRLRMASTGLSLDDFDALVERLRADTPLREDAQIALSKLRDTGGYDLWVIAQPGAVVTEPWFVIFPMIALSMFLVIVASLFWHPAVIALAGGAIAGIVMRSVVGKYVRAAVAAFRQIGPLLAAATALQNAGPHGAAPLLATLRGDVARLGRLRTIASWVGRDAAAATSGDIGSLIVEYLNLIFCLDANALFFGARELRARGADMMRVIAAVGDVDSAIAVASYRAGTTGWVRPSFLPAGSPAVMTGLRHPLLPGAVANSITLGPPHGVIITGSNMSGKTTFLRTVGASAILAQTINTCVADVYESPRFMVRSCIGRADDPATGKSYYLVEVESVLELVRASETDTPHLFMFDELFRGTNAVERIAAGEAVLVSLVSPKVDGSSTPHVVLAATHDQELVDLLGGLYTSYHFSDTVDDAGLSFDYRLRPGAATTRNAIALLRLRGAPADLVDRAMTRAAQLDRVKGAC